MMILRSAGPSPFARKVEIAAHVLGLADRLEVRPTAVDDPGDPIATQNPLGKIPALIAEDGAVWYDSRVILEYLDIRAGGGRIVPAAPAQRLAALRLQALADGWMDAAILVIYEARYRPPEMRVDAWVDRQTARMARALAALENAPPPRATATPDVGQIALAAALGYGDLRFAGAWRSDHPNLVAWLDAFAAAVPAFEATRLKA